ncbi:hypothetical protein U1Q18_004918 [Sarracenia purpurea var. burkii]
MKWILGGLSRPLELVPFCVTSTVFWFVIGEMEKASRLGDGSGSGDSSFKCPKILRRSRAQKESGSSGVAPAKRPSVTHSKDKELSREKHNPAMDQ